MKTLIKKTSNITLLRVEHLSKARLPILLTVEDTTNDVIPKL